MKSLDAATIAALSGPQLSVIQLVYMAFASPIALNTSVYDIEFGGVLYKGAGALGTISEIDDSPGEIKGLNFQLIGVDSGYIALALDDAAVVQGTPVEIRTAILDANYQIVDAPMEWTGRLDTMNIEEDGETCTISVSAESSAVDVLRGNALTYSDADQQSLYPGDRAFEYQIGQLNAQIVWPSRAYYIAKGS